MRVQPEDGVGTGTAGHSRGFAGEALGVQAQPGSFGGCGQEAPRGPPPSRTALPAQAREGLRARTPEAPLPNTTRTPRPRRPAGGRRGPVEPPVPPPPRAPKFPTPAGTTHTAAPRLHLCSQLPGRNCAAGGRARRRGRPVPPAPLRSRGPASRRAHTRARPGGPESPALPGRSRRLPRGGDGVRAPSDQRRPGAGEPPAAGVRPGAPLADPTTAAGLSGVPRRGTGER